MIEIKKVFTGCIWNISVKSEAVQECALDIASFNFFARALLLQH